MTRTITGGVLPPSRVFVAEVMLLTKEDFLARYGSDGEEQESGPAPERSEDRQQSTAVSFDE